MSEQWWWDNLEGDEIMNNAYGVPPYEVEAVADFIDKHINFGTRVLDLGCGPGRLGHVLCRRHPQCFVHGVDFSQQMVNLSYTNGPNNWTARCNDGITIPSDLYDGAYSVTVFQHLPHEIVKEYMAQVYQQLITGGHFLFTYATGTEDKFLMHQASHEVALSWLNNAGFKSRLLRTPPDHPAWFWAIGEK